MRTEPALAPGAPFYKRLWRGWKRVGRAVGMLVSRITVTILYFVVVTPFAIGVRLFSDPLELAPGPTHWKSLPPPAGIEEARRGF
jgi:hypothetical protein